MKKLILIFLIFVSISCYGQFFGLNGSDEWVPAGPIEWATLGVQSSDNDSISTLAFSDYLEINDVMILHLVIDATNANFSITTNDPGFTLIGNSSNGGITHAVYWVRFDYDVTSLEYFTVKSDVSPNNHFRGYFIAYRNVNPSGLPYSISGILTPNSRDNISINSISGNTGDALIFRTMINVNEDITPTCTTGWSVRDNVTNSGYGGYSEQADEYIYPTSESVSCQHNWTTFAYDATFYMVLKQ